MGSYVNHHAIKMEMRGNQAANRCNLGDSCRNYHSEAELRRAPDVLHGANFPSGDVIRGYKPAHHATAPKAAPTGPPKSGRMASY